MNFDAYAMRATTKKLKRRHNIKVTHHAKQAKEGSILAIHITEKLSSELYEMKSKQSLQL